MASNNYRVFCGVAKDKCVGSLLPMSASFKDVKAHNSHKEAFDCMKSSLLAEGYTPVDSRALRPPGDGPVRVLTKQSRYGARLRPGKRGESGGSGVITRHMPDHRYGGVIISK